MTRRDRRPNRSAASPDCIVLQAPFIEFDLKYVVRSSISVAMFVANGVVGDSRVLKTAQTLRKLGFRVTLFGTAVNSETVIPVEGYPFRIILVPVKGHWRFDDGSIDYSAFVAAVGSEVKEQVASGRFDILHTHDMLGLPVGALIQEHLGSRLPWLHDIHEYVRGLTHLSPQSLDYFVRAEAQHIHKPDALTCVSPALAETLVRELELPKLPTVVLNTPRYSDLDRYYPNPIRAALGIKADKPLLVYSGGTKEVRGLETLLAALPAVPDAQLAIVSNSKKKRIQQLEQCAARYGLNDKVHFVPYVPFWNVTSFLNDASIGVHPIKRYPNAEIALPNKLFEYLHARIPVVVSDNAAMHEFTKVHRCGEVFAADDSDSLAAAINTVLRRTEAGEFPQDLFEGLAQEFCWEAQEVVLDRIYQNLVPDKSGHVAPERMRAGMRIIHLPAASAGQPDQFVQGLLRCGLDARSLQVTRHTFSYGADINLEGLYPPDVAKVLNGLCKDFDIFHFHRRSLLYKKTLLFPNAIDLTALKLAGKKVFLHFRGSEIRLPSIFAKMCPYHYIDDSEDEVGALPARFNEADQRILRDLASTICDGVFVTDPELQTYVPDAVIVPRVKCLEELPPAPPRRRQRPLIVHAPSNRGAKGTDRIVEVVSRMAKQGHKFDFKLVENLPHREALAIFREADILIDQLRIGWYGVTAVEGMALGKAVVTYIRDDLKHYLPLPSPIAFANPDTLEDVLADLIVDPDRIMALGAEGRRFVERYHCAERTCRTLSNLYGEPPKEIVPGDVVLLGLQSEINYSNSVKKRLSGIYKQRYQAQFDEKFSRKQAELRGRNQARFAEKFSKERNPQNIGLGRRALRSLVYRSRKLLALLR